MSPPDKSRVSIVSAERVSPVRQHSAWIISARQRAGSSVTGVSSHHSVPSVDFLSSLPPPPRPSYHPIPPHPHPRFPARGGGGGETQSSRRLLRCLVRQMFHLLSQLASSPRKTSSTGFHLLSLCLVGWGKGLSLCFDPPLPSLPLGSPSLARTNRTLSNVSRLAAPELGPLDAQD